VRRVAAIMAVLLLLGLAYGHTSQEGYPFGPGIPNFDEVSRWGPLEIERGGDSYVRMLSAVYWWNETGSYITVKFRAYEHIYAGELAIESVWGELLGIQRIYRWLEPGVHTITLPVRTFALETYSHLGKLHAIIQIPRKTIPGALPRYSDYQYELEVEPLPEPVTISEGCSASAHITIHVPEHQWYSALGSRYLILLYWEDSPSWSPRQWHLGSIRQGAQVVEHPEWSVRIHVRTPEEAEKAALEILTLTLTMLQRGLTVKPEQVFKDAWERAGKPQLQPLNGTALIVQKGDCPTGATRCTSEPLIARWMMEEALSGRIPVTVEIQCYKQLVTGKARIGGATLTLITEEKHTITASHTEEGTKPSHTTRTTTRAVLGPPPKEKEHTHHSTWRWLTAKLTYRPTETSPTRTTTTTVLPKLPPPTQKTP